MTDYKTCNYLYDDGHTCKSPAVTRRDYCVFHLRDRASQLRAAQYRARSLRFDLQLPPLENMHAVQSAISHVVQALAADMIEPRRAHEILTGLRHAASNFKNPAAWQPSAFADNPSEAPAIEYNNLEAEFGLPDGLDINTPPEVAFPPPSTPSPDVILREARSDESKDPFISVNGSVFLAGIDRTPLIPEVPPFIPRDYAAEAEIALFETTPEDVELNEILKTQGIQAMESRALEHQRNSRRRLMRKHFRANYERYAAEAKTRNIKRAAEQLLAQKLAAEKAAPQVSAPDTQPVTPPEEKKRPAAAGATQLGQKEPKMTA